jgi:hypothetical protein
MTQYGGDDNGAEIPETPDRVKLSGDTTSYTNSSHWTSKLIHYHLVFTAFST